MQSKGLALPCAALSIALFCAFARLHFFVCRLLKSMRKTLCGGGVCCRCKGPKPVCCRRRGADKSRRCKDGAAGALCCERYAANTMRQTLCCQHCVANSVQQTPCGKHKFCGIKKGALRPLCAVVILRFAARAAAATLCLRGRPASNCQACRWRAAPCGRAK